MNTTKTIDGTVAWFNDAKGFGFIRSDHVQGDIFVHYTALIGNGFKTLAEGQAVSFELTTGPKGPQAFNVSKIGPTVFKWACESDSETCTEEEPCQSCCDHSDLCKGICLTCGYDRRGEMLADRIDRALDWDKDNS